MMRDPRMEWNSYRSNRIRMLFDNKKRGKSRGLNKPFVNNSHEARHLVLPPPLLISIPVYPISPIRTKENFHGLSLVARTRISRNEHSRIDCVGSESQTRFIASLVR